MIDTNNEPSLTVKSFRSIDWSSLARSGSVRRETPETAPELPVVMACIRVLAESISSLPLNLYRYDENGAKVKATDVPLYKVLHSRPNAEQTSLELREQLCFHFLLYGNAFCEIIRSNNNFVTDLLPLHPSRMEVERLSDGSLRYVYREPNAKQTIYQPRQIWHIRMPSLDGINGISVPTMVKDAIAHARALEQHGLTYFSNGARPGCVLQSDSAIPTEAAERIREQWERIHRGADRAHRTAVLPNGLKVHELTGSNENSQFIDARKLSVIEICRAFRVPPHLVQSLEGATYSNIEAQGREFLTYSLLPHLRRIEDSIARDLISRDDLFAEHDVHAFMRADSGARSAYYAQMLSSGVMSINEVRAMENMNPIGPEGDERYMQSQFVTVKSIANQKPPEEPQSE